MKILPGQWPPLNCPTHLLSRFNTEPPGSIATPAVDQPDAPMASVEVGGMDRPMQHVPLAQLRQEKLKLEKHILELPNDGFAALREQLEATLTATTKEIQQRKPAGQSLDQALARHKAATRARAIAEEHLQQSEDALTRAKQALQTARDHELQTGQDVAKVRALIAEDDGGEASKAAPVPPNVMHRIYQILQVAGLDSTHLAAVADVMGSPMPPPPPAPPQSQPAGLGPVLVNNTGSPNDQSLLPPANGVGLLGAPSGQAARSPLQQGQEEALAHPANLASQLLAGSPPDKGEAPGRRAGRSPARRRKLPPRGGDADYAPTFKDESVSSRGASRTPDRGGRSREVSPTQPMGALQPLASSLQGVAPPS